MMHYVWYDMNKKSRRILDLYNFSNDTESKFISNCFIIPLSVQKNFNFLKHTWLIPCKISSQHFPISRRFQHKKGCIFCRWFLKRQIKINWEIISSIFVSNWIDNFAFCSPQAELSTLFLDFGTNTKIAKATPPPTLCHAWGQSWILWKVQHLII